MKYHNIKISAVDLNMLYHVHNIDKARGKDYYQRFGQRFMNELLTVENSEGFKDPDLFYEQDDKKAYDLIMKLFNIQNDTLEAEDIMADRVRGEYYADEEQSSSR